jgi:hypothetical protein
MKKESKKILLGLTLICTFCIAKKGYAQDVDLENFYKPNFKVTGTILTNAMYYDSNMPNQRDPFTYLLSGNLNVSAFNFNIPLFYRITNQGKTSGYTSPFDFNRLSLMPKYKWIKAYIGNGSMTFSPYTLSGIPFKGLGLELTPKNPFKITLMGGKLLKTVTAEEAQSGIPVYERYGYGTKISFEKPQYKIGWIGFYAKDNINSLERNTTKGVTAKENFVNSFIFSSSIIKNLNFNVEYALSVLTDDILSPKKTRENFTDKLFSSKENTQFLNAVNVNFDYNIQKSLIGLTYERIDPNYSTLGAMYFNNDLENIVMRFSRPLHKDKIMIATNIGYQRDDLAKTKKQDTKRIVGSINLNFRVTDQLNFTGNYSNFSTYTNKKLDQFELINNPNVVPADTLDYRQLSQNATINVSYAYGKKKNQNLNFNYSIAGQANEQGGIIRKGQASTIQNYNLVHSVNYIEMKIALNSSLNYTSNEVGKNNTSALGASVGASKKLFKDKLNSNLGILYNNSNGNNNSSAVFGIKFNNSYLLLDQHNFNLSIVSMFRSSTNVKNFNDLAATFNYSYSIDKIKLSARKEINKEPKVVLEPILKIKYKENTYQGTRNEINSQLSELQLNLRPIPKEDLDQLQHLLTLTTLTHEEDSFKEKALEYLKAYDLNNQILNKYNQYIINTVKSLKQEIIRKDELFENNYTIAQGKVNTHFLHGVDEKNITNRTSYKSYLKLVERKNKKLTLLLIHRWMLNELTILSNTALNEIHQNENLSVFNKQELLFFFKMMKAQKKDVEIIEELKARLIPFYDHLAKDKTINNEIEFKFLYKIK